jgi:hypothetical protein
MSLNQQPAVDICHLLIVQPGQFHQLNSFLRFREMGIPTVALSHKISFREIGVGLWVHERANLY